MIMRSFLSIVLAGGLVLPAVAEPAPPVLSILAKQIIKTDDAGTQLNLLRGMNAALKGRRGLTPPPEWTAVSQKLSQSPNAEVRDLMQAIGTIFGSSDAFDALRTMAADEKAELPARKKALESLVNGKDADTPALLKQLIGTAGPLRGDAIRGLAAFNEADTVDKIMGKYASLSADEKRDALGTIASRPAWAKSLVTLIEEKKIPRAEVSVTLVRQLRGFNDSTINEALDRTFGKMSGGSADKQADIARIKEWLTADFVKSGDPVKGREVFSRTCALCHKLFDAGAEIGPELTGANRADIDYLLQNIVDPNALVGEDYQLNTVELKDGRVLAGMVKGSDANTITLRTMTETLTVPVADVKAKTVNPMSMMPEGLLLAMSHEEARDLFRYLASQQQVAPPK